MSPGKLREELFKSRASVSHGSAKVFCCKITFTDSESSRYRHQLNHAPKQIYNCDFPDCSSTFFRKDLCDRHRARHTGKGSLNRNYSKLRSVHTSPITESGKPLSMHGSSSPEAMSPNLTAI